MVDKEVAHIAVNASANNSYRTIAGAIIEVWTSNDTQRLGYQNMPLQGTHRT